MRGICRRFPRAVKLVNGLQPTSREIISTRPPIQLSDSTGHRTGDLNGYSSAPKLLRLARANCSIPLGLELENPNTLTSTPDRDRNWGRTGLAGTPRAAEHELPGLRVTSVWVGGIQ